MQPDNTLEHSEIFNKLKHLEEQVSSLTSELAIDKETINRLQNLLTEKQATIQDLQTALNNAQQTLKEQASISIAQIKQQIINTTDQNYITPLKQLLQREIDRIQSLIDETKQFINAQMQSINNTISNTNNLLSALPEQSKAYFTQAYASVVETQINTLIETINRYIENTKTLSQEKLILPVKNSIEKVITYSKEKTATLHFHVEDKLITSPRESISEFFDDLYFICKEFFKEILYQIQKILLGLINALVNWVKQSKPYTLVSEKITSLRHPPEEEVYA